MSYPLLIGLLTTSRNIDYRYLPRTSDYTIWRRVYTHSKNDMRYSQPGPQKWDVGSIIVRLCHTTILKGVYSFGNGAQYLYRKDLVMPSMKRISRKLLRRDILGNSLHPTPQISSSHPNPTLPPGYRRYVYCADRHKKSRASTIP